MTEEPDRDGVSSDGAAVVVAHATARATVTARRLVRIVAAEVIVGP